MNLRIKHEGMGWPVGAVIPASALAKNGADHIAIGAVEPTDYPVTHSPIVSAEKPASNASALVENERLRAEILNLEGKVAGQTEELKKLLAQAEKLQADNAALEKLLEETTAAKEVKDHAAEQARLEAGPNQTV